MGNWIVHQHIPRAVIGAPPSDETVPPQLAVEVVIALTACVVNSGTDKLGVTGLLLLLEQLMSKISKNINKPRVKRIKEKLIEPFTLFLFLSCIMIFK